MASYKNIQMHPSIGVLALISAHAGPLYLYRTGDLTFDCIKIGIFDKNIASDVKVKYTFHRDDIFNPIHS